MWYLAPLAFLIHAAGMLVDEGFHRRRSLPAWERWGHPLDTLTVLACYLCALVAPRTYAANAAFIGLAAFSCLFVTKDEWVHAERCSGSEMWLHAFLFLMHPVLLAIVAAWRMLPGPVDAGRNFFAAFLVGQTAVTALFMLYQLLYWNGPWKPALQPNA